MPKAKKSELENTLGNCVTRVIHADSIKHGAFTPFSSVKRSPVDKLVCLHGKRLIEPVNSPSHMEDRCNAIPENMIEEDFRTTRHHRGCYHDFTKYMYRLKAKSSLICDFTPSCSQQLGSNVKPSAGTNVYPPECIFYGRRTKMWLEGRNVLLALWHAERTKWIQREPRSLQSKKMDLHRVLRGEDLFCR